MIPDKTHSDPFDTHSLSLDSMLEYDSVQGSPLWDIDPALHHDDDTIFDQVLSNERQAAEFANLDVDDIMFSGAYEGFDNLFTSGSSASSPSSSPDDDEGTGDAEDDIDFDDLLGDEEDVKPIKRKASDEPTVGKRGKKAPAKPRARNAISQHDLARVNRECNTEEAKRRVHNISERNRRGNMKHQYHALRTCIPELAGSERPSNRTILSKAVDCIMDLQRQDRDMEIQLQILRDENKRLQSLRAN